MGWNHGQNKERILQQSVGITQPANHPGGALNSSILSFYPDYPKKKTDGTAQNVDGRSSNKR
jgi:hypothetical protein